MNTKVNQTGFGAFPSKPLDGKRHVSKRSVRFKKKELDKNLLVNDGKPWNNATIDVLLECCLTKEYKYKSKRGCYLKKCGRSLDSIGTMLRKLGIRYPDYAHYRPKQRTRRNGQPFTKNDYAFMELATNETGVKYRATDPGWLMKVLARSNEEIQAEFTRLAAVREGPMAKLRRKQAEAAQTTPITLENRWEDETFKAAIREALKGMFKQLLENL